MSSECEVPILDERHTGALVPPGFDPSLLSDVYRRWSPHLVGRLRRHYPTSCPSLVADAVHDAFVEVLRRPSSAAQRWRDQGEVGVVHLLALIGWRKLRAHWRRKAHRVELGVPCWTLVPAAVDAGQETVVGLLRRLGPALDLAVSRCGAADPAPVRAALEDKLRTGDPDTVVAKRHGVRREYLNRAKRHLEADLLGVAGI